jgi:hypothetical protein
MRPLRTACLAAALAAISGIAALAGAAGAQEAEPPPAEAGLPPITVRPSGVQDDGEAARARQERLARRLERSDYVFRHICTHCMNRRGPEEPAPPPVDPPPSRP